MIQYNFKFIKNLVIDSIWTIWVRKYQRACLLRGMFYFLIISCWTVELVWVIIWTTRIKIAFNSIWNRLQNVEVRVPSILHAYLRHLITYLSVQIVVVLSFWVVGRISVEEIEWVYLKIPVLKRVVKRWRGVVSKELQFILCDNLII